MGKLFFFLAEISISCSSQCFNLDDFPIKNASVIKKVKTTSQIIFSSVFLIYFKHKFNIIFTKFSFIQFFLSNSLNVSFRFTWLDIFYFILLQFFVEKNVNLLLYFVRFKKVLLLLLFSKPCWILFSSTQFSNVL